MDKKVDKPKEQWRKELTPEQFRITREKGTEPSFSGEYLEKTDDGTYRCVCCGNELFSSDTKYKSGSGWPSFWAPLKEANVETREDPSHGMRRIEVLCSRCGAHLGHVFPDGPKPTGQRYCINSASLSFEPESESTD